MMTKRITRLLVLATALLICNLWLQARHQTPGRIRITHGTDMAGSSEPDNSTIVLTPKPGLNNPDPNFALARPADASPSNESR
jgi:hypothetical protein